jgi:hypothetical protein
MNSFFKVSVLFCLLLFLSQGVYAKNLFEQSKGEVALGSFFSESSGNLSYGNTVAGTSLDLNSDLGYSDESTFYGRVKYFMTGRFPDFSLNGYFFNYEGSGAKTFNYGDQSFDDNAFSSDLTIQAYDLSLFFPIRGVTIASLGHLRLDIGGTVRWINFENNVKESDLSVKTEDNDFCVSLYTDLLYRPMTGLEFAVEAKVFSLTSTSFSNITGRVSYNFYDEMFASVGYITDSMEYDNNGLKIDIDNDGYFIEVGYRF